MIFFVGMAFTAVLMGYAWGFKNSRNVRIGTFVFAVLLNIGTGVYVLLPAISFGTASSASEDSVRVVASYDAVQPRELIPIPQCMRGESAGVKLVAANIALRSGGGNWTTQQHSDGWLVIFTPKESDAPPLFAPLAMMTRNDNPAIGVRVVCSPSKNV